MKYTYTIELANSRTAILLANFLLSYADISDIICNYRTLKFHGSSISQHHIDDFFTANPQISATINKDCSDC